MATNGPQLLKKNPEKAQLKSTTKNKTDKSVSSTAGSSVSVKPEQNIESLGFDLVNSILSNEPNENFVSNDVWRSGFVIRPAHYNLNLSTCDSVKISSDLGINDFSDAVEFEAYDKINKAPVRVILSSNKPKLWDLYSRKRYQKDNLSYFNPFGVTVISSPVSKKQPLK